jgi:type I pantothenate kinase
MRLRKTAFSDPAAYFYRYSRLSDEEARETARHIWETINLANLRANILPTRQRARLILQKVQDHTVQTVHLRKI